MRSGKWFLALLAAAVWVVPGLSSEKDQAARQPFAPLPRQVPASKDNPTTHEKVALGKQLFFDPRLSGDNRMSCATCHPPEKFFADGLAGAKGHRGKTLIRNTPSLLNVAFQSRFFWDGRATSLEEQALGPIQAPDEMHQDLGELERELAAVPGYAKQFQQVFGTPVTRAGIAQALAAFERTLVTEPSPFDRYLAGDKAALSDSAQRGLELFRGDAGCVRCHSGPLLSDEKFYRLGVSAKDQGLASVTGKPADAGKFRTPPLRNVARTGPYMHDGSQRTLQDVVEFYYRGAPTKSADGLPFDIEPLTGRSFSEVSDVVTFLESLSGEPPKIEVPPLPR